MGAIPSRSGSLVRFGVFEVDLRSGELRKNGAKIKLQEQPFQVLQFLLEHAGEVVTREDLHKRVWPSDTFVDFDHGLYNAIKRLREALGDSAENPRFIETLSRRGYRFIGQVSGYTESIPRDVSETNGTIVSWPVEGEAVDASRKDLPVSATTKSTSELPFAGTAENRYRRRTVLTALAGTGALILFLGVLVVLASSRYRRTALETAPQIRSIAVLPLQNLSGDPAQEYFADGMTEELITELSRFSGLKVISRTSVMRYKKTDKSLPEIARELNVDGIVEGSVLHSGDRVRITAQLIYAPRDVNLWAETYDRDLRDVLVLQSTVAGAVAREIKVKLTPTEVERLNSPKRVNPKALDLYLEGNHHLRENDDQSLDSHVLQAQESFRRAIQEDPEFAQAYVALAGSYYNMMLRPLNMWQLQKEAAGKALAVDPNSSEAHVILGSVNFAHYWDWQGAEKEFRRAIELNPNSASAHSALGLLLDSTNRPDEAINELQLAVELDPESTDWAIYEVRSVAFQKKFNDAGQRQAIARLKRAFQDQDNAMLHLMLYELYADNGQDEVSMHHIERAAVGFGFPDTGKRISRALRTSGVIAAKREYAREIERVNEAGQLFRPFMTAEAYARIGDREKTWKWLQKAYETRDDYLAGGLTTSRALKSFHSDPRYADLVHKVGLPELPLP